jgi:hypothetical protein
LPLIKELHLKQKYKEVDHKKVFPKEYSFFFAICMLWCQSIKTLHFRAKRIYLFLMVCDFAKKMKENIYKTTINIIHERQDAK